MLRPLLDDAAAEGEAEAVALAAKSVIDVVDAIDDEIFVEVGALVDDVAAADDDEVTPIVAARTNVSPEEQQLFSASSPQHHDPSGHKLNRALFARPPSVSPVPVHRFKQYGELHDSSEQLLRKYCTCPFVTQRQTPFGRHVSASGLFIAQHCDGFPPTLLHGAKLSSVICVPFGA